MTSDLDNSGASRGDRRRSLAYHRDFWPGIVGYAVVLSVVIGAGHLDGTSPWRFVWAVLPVVPAFWVVRAVVRHLGRIDDYQRSLLLRGLAVGFAVAMVASLTIGFLDLAKLGVPAPGWIIYSAGMLGWLAGGWAARNR
jgi:hypothetical protein